jgi:hypothetical protein
MKRGGFVLPWQVALMVRSPSYVTGTSGNGAEQYVFCLIPTYLVL